MRQMTRDPNAAAKARLAEERANEEAGLRAIVGSVDLGASGGAGERKKRPVFKSTLQPHNAVAVTGKPPPPAEPRETGAVRAEPVRLPSPTPPASLPVASSTEMAEDGGKSVSDDAQLDREGEEDGDEEKEHEVSFDFEEEEEGKPEDDSMDARQRWAERYRPLQGPTELRDVVFTYGRMQVV